MTFERIQPEKLSHAVVRQIELSILRGILRPGERLPSERELAERMGVSRPSLRDAVAELQTKGLLTSRAGAWPDIVEDGVTGYLTDTGDLAAITRALGVLLQDIPQTQRMGERGHAVVQARYSVEREARELTTYLLSLADP